MTQQPQLISALSAAAVLHGGGLHHCPHGRVSHAAEKEEEGLHPHRLLHLLHHRLLKHHAGVASSWMSLELLDASATGVCLFTESLSL